MLNCHDATRLMSEKLEHKLSLAEAINLRFHLMICKGCSHFNQHMLSLRQFTRAYAKGRGATVSSHEDPPPDTPI